MIFITQGHERSISLETLLKSFYHFSMKELKKFTLCCNYNSLENSLKNLDIDYKLGKSFFSIGNKSISIIGFDEEKLQSTKSLTTCLSKIKKDDILLTLPTSKDQLVFNSEKTFGHTDFFRKYFNKKDLSMFFDGPFFNSLLITDHCPLKEVSSSITEDLIFQKVSITLKSFSHLKNVFISGINPHSGENGLLGTEEYFFESLIKKLQKKFPQNVFMGPISGDSLHQKQGHLNLLVYMHHDQGLAPFKLAQSFIGANITLGLPFLRISPDHGTAFDLYGKNKANYFGTLYCLKKSLEYHERNSH